MWLRQSFWTVWADDVPFLPLWIGESHPPYDGTSPGSTVTLPSQPSTPQAPNKLPRTAEVQRDANAAEGSTSKAKPTIIDLLLTPPPSTLKGKGKRKADEPEDALGEGSPSPAKRTRGDRDNDCEEVAGALPPLALHIPPATRMEGGDIRMRTYAPEDHRTGTREGAASNNAGVPIADAEVRSVNRRHPHELLTTPSLTPGESISRLADQGHLLIAPGAIRISRREVL